MDNNVPIITKSLNNESNYTDNSGLEYYYSYLYIFII